MIRQAALSACLQTCVAAISLALLASAAVAAPSIASITPRGLQIGQPTTIVVSGTDLPSDARLIVDADIARQTVKPGAKPDRLEIEVVLGDAVQPGLYPIRLAGPAGISGPVIVGVDRLTQRAFSSKVEALPIAMHGAVGGAQVLKSTLDAKKDQRIVIDIEAQRIGSGLKPVLRLYDPRGTQIAWSAGKNNIGGDARVEAVLPADGRYTIELHDQLFRPAGAGFFRLKIGDLQYADLALPLAVTAGSKQAVKLASASGPQEAELDATSVQIPSETVATVPACEHFTGAAPRIAVTDLPEVLENSEIESASLQPLPAPPVAVSGILSGAGQEDRYALTVAPRQRLRFEVVARQFGSPLDGVLTIRNDQGEQLATADDRPGSSDPLLEFTVPAKTTRLQIGLKDLLGRGGQDFVYRVVVRDATQPDFALTLPSDRINVPAGGAQVVSVQVARTNYDGPIELALEKQPPELQLYGNVIPAGATIGLLTLAAQDVSPQADLTRLIGRSSGAQHEIVRAAAFAEIPGARYQPRIRNQIGLAVTRPSPIQIAWLPGDDDHLFLGGKLAARVRLTREEGTAGKVRIRLLTSQPTPKKTVREGMQERTVDDLDRSLRLEGDPTFGPGEQKFAVNILVPSDLARQPWDLVLIGELLSKDGKNVVASIAAPVRTLEPVAPFTLALSGPTTAEGKAGTGEPGKLAGKVSRAPGYTQPVIITLDNLPGGYTAPQVLLPGDKDEFELPLSFTYATKAGELKGAKLVAVAAPLTARSVRSNTVDVAINVVPGEKPSLEPPKEVFEDDESFITMLTEGGGRAIPDQRDKYSGAYSLRVTPDQKFNAKLANLGVKIRENPGPGEYRYIRFAWKKAQGNAVCLQLAHDGKFGPVEKGKAKGEREGASFRYHAGPGSECFGASLVVSDKLPNRFEVVTRDLFLDFGEFTLTGLAFSPVDGQAALFDHIYLAQKLDDFELIKAGTSGGETGDE